MKLSVWIVLVLGALGLRYGQTVVTRTVVETIIVDEPEDFPSQWCNTTALNATGKPFPTAPPISLQPFPTRKYGLQFDNDGHLRIGREVHTFVPSSETSATSFNSATSSLVGTPSEALN